MLKFSPPSPVSPCESLHIFLLVSFLLTPSPSPPLLLRTAPLLPLTLLLEIVLCFLAIHPLRFILHRSAPPVFFYPVSPSLLTFHLITLSASGYSVNFCIFFLCISFPLFLSLHLVCPWGNLSTTMLSVTALPLHLPPSLPVSFCLVSLSLADSAALHVSLPLLLLLWVTNYAHICAHTSSDRTCHTRDFVQSSVLRSLPCPSSPPSFF